MLKLIDNLEIRATVRNIKKAQRKNKIEKIEESELETISKQLDNYNLLCVIPNRKLGIYQIFAENQEEYVFKVLTDDLKERKSESYNKKKWRKGVAAFQQFIAYYSDSVIYMGDSKEQRDIFIRKIQAKEDPNLVNRISSTKKFEGKILSTVDNGLSYKVITQTDEGYNIITLDSDSLEEKASKFYPTLTIQDKIKSLPYKVAIGSGGLAIILSPYLLMPLGVKEEIVNSLRMPTVAMAVGLWMSIPFIGRRKYKIKKAYMEQFNIELYKYARP